MKKILSLAIILLSLFLVASAAFAQLTDREKNIYYDFQEWFNTVQWETQASQDLDAAWEELSVKEDEYLKGKGLTREQFYNIEEKVNHTPLSAEERQVALELKTNLASYGKEVPDDVHKKVCSELSKKYGMRPGEVFDVYNAAILEIHSERIK